MGRFCIILHDGDIDEATKTDLRARFEAHEECQWCGGIHQGYCPRVRKVVFHPNDDRQIREVEFWSDSEWRKDNIVFPEDCI